MSRKPDYIVGALDKAGGGRNPKIGVAWKKEGGAIGIRLDQFVVLRGGPDLVVTLFPNDREHQQQQAAGEDDIPFDLDWAPVKGTS